jgi:hypothetical protein
VIYPEDVSLRRALLGMLVRFLSRVAKSPSRESRFAPTTRSAEASTPSPKSWAFSISCPSSKLIRAKIRAIPCHDGVRQKPCSLLPRNLGQLGNLLPPEHAHEIQAASPSRLSGQLRAMARAIANPPDPLTILEGSLSLLPLPRARHP